MGFGATNGTRWPSIADYRKAAANALRDLETIRDHGPLPQGAIPLIAVVRNERLLINSFLAHYRALGVTRFMFIDNDSSDGTFEALLAAPDVDLWRTQHSFEAANHGGLWVDGLLWAKASNRWILYVDADEFLVLPTMKEAAVGNTLSAFVQRLRWRNETRLFAPMLDVYSDRPILETVIGQDANPFEKLRWFDGEPETLTFDDPETGGWVVGGPRRRLFFPDEPEQRPGLGKYPLAYYDHATAFIGVHAPTPPRRNFLKPFGRLLHVKLHAGLASKAELAVQEGQHWQGAVEYKQYLRVLSDQPNLTAHFSGSIEYTGPKSLIDARLMYDPSVGLADLARGVLRRVLPRTLRHRLNMALRFFMRANPS